MSEAASASDLCVNIFAKPDPAIIEVEIVLPVIAFRQASLEDREARQCGHTGSLTPELARLSQLGQAGGEFWGWEGGKGESLQR